MEQIINRLRIPFWITAIVVILIVISQAHNNYWQGKLAKIKYMKEKQSL
jgi:hypothetical protein